MNTQACRVCGFIDPEGEPPWGADNNTPTFDFCLCCGVEFGVEDSSYETMKQFRRNWLRAGAKWDEPKTKPANWNVAEQLENVSPDEDSLRLAAALGEVDNL